MSPSELESAMKQLGLGPVAMAKSLGCSYNTFKQWKGGQRTMTPVAVRAVELLLAIQGTDVGRKFGV